MKDHNIENLNPKPIPLSNDHMDKPPEILPVEYLEVSHEEYKRLFDQCKDHALECCCDLEESIRVGWKRVQPDCRPDESFRAMLKIMLKFVKYMEKQKDMIEIPCCGICKSLMQRVIGDNSPGWLCLMCYKS